MSARYSVTFDGKSAVVHREVDVMRRRWLGLRPPIADVERSVVGIYACDMSLTMRRELGRPSELTVVLAGRSIVLWEHFPAPLPATDPKG